MDSKTYTIVGAGITMATIVGVSVAVWQNQPQSSTVTSALPPTSPPPTQTGTPTPLLPASPRMNGPTRVAPTVPKTVPKTVSKTAPSIESTEATQTPSPQSPARSRPTRQVESCTIRMAKVSDPNPPLNVRSSPRVVPDNIVSQLPNGTYVAVAREQVGWFQITMPVVGWVAKDRTEYSCALMTVRLNLPASGGSVTITDRFVGTGSHSYLFSAKQGQTITITARRGPLPTLLKPDGQPALYAEENQTILRGVLPSTGDYSLEFDSSFKGFDYSFTVEVQ